MTVQTKDGLRVRLDAPVIERHRTYSWLPKLRGRVVVIAHDWVLVQWETGQRMRVDRDRIGHDHDALVELMPNE